MRLYNRQTLVTLALQVALIIAVTGLFGGVALVVLPVGP